MTRPTVGFCQSCLEQNKSTKPANGAIFLFLMQIGISTSRIFHESPEFFQLLTDRSIC